MKNLKYLIIATAGFVTLTTNSFYLPYNESKFNTSQIITDSQEDNSPHSEHSEYLNLINDTIIETYGIKNSKNDLPLIYDSTTVDYMSYVPDIICSDDIEEALDIENPDIEVAASSAILFNAETGEVLYHKDPVLPVFPASTTKLLTALVALEWCSKDEKITIGDEVQMITSDSSSANLRQGEKLTFSTLLESMLIPSGNDAAYVVAVHVGMKSLGKSKAKNMDAVKEFAKLMNSKAKELGAENSNFITPDGYDAKGQYTTAYDMGMIGLAASKNKTILSITKKTTVKRTLSSGRTYTWTSSNNLLKKDSPYYYSNAVGLKTGTTTMAGKCLVSIATKNNQTVVSVIMNSSSEGRWLDSIKLLKYGLKKLE
jgi:D-alanyl-D-alanine carboxypeptidase (penicillin-binding protein 5/6)